MLRELKDLFKRSQQAKKIKRIQFHGSRSSTSLDRSVGGGGGGGNYHNRRTKGQKIAFSRKFPFMKSRERLNRLDDEEEDPEMDESTTR